MSTRATAFAEVESVTPQANEFRHPLTDVLVLYVSPWLALGSYYVVRLLDDILEE